MNSDQCRARESGSLSLDKMFRIIECMVNNRLPNRLTDLAKKLEMPAPTVLRYLRALCAAGYAYHDETTGRYALTWKICKLGDAVKINLVLRSMASPFLNAMANTLNMGACLVVANGMGTMYLDFVDNPANSSSTLIRIGKNAPIHTTGSGKVLLSSFSDLRVQEIVTTTGLVRLTPHTITDRDALMRELAQVRRQGYAVDDQECEIGHKCISVPLYDYTNSVVAAISVFDKTQRLPETRIQEEILPLLRKTAKEISFRMGYDGDEPAKAGGDADSPPK